MKGKNLRDKLKLLNASHEDARCPLCDASLGEEGCARLAATYGEEIQQKRREYSENQGSLKDLQSQEQRLTSET